jgi:hypothetical protein
MNALPKRQAKRQRERDRKSERAVTKLRQTPIFADLPMHVLRGYAQLAVLAQEVRAKLQEHGLINEKGEWSQGIDVFRRLKDSESKYLSLMLDLASKDQRAPKPVLDLDDFRDEKDN